MLPITAHLQGHPTRGHYLGFVHFSDDQDLVLVDREFLVVRPITLSCRDDLREWFRRHHVSGRLEGLLLFGIIVDEAELDSGVERDNILVLKAVGDRCHLGTLEEVNVVHLVGRYLNSRCVEPFLNSDSKGKILRVVFGQFAQSKRLVFLPG